MEGQFVDHPLQPQFQISGSIPWRPPLEIDNSALPPTAR
jgi:hypothetical protein